jgi:biotin transport system substrate-specific component
MNESLASRDALAGGFLASRTARRAGAVVLFAILTALGASIAVPIPGTAVPVTMQSMFVSLSGVLLGPMLGAAAQALYLLAGALGAPVFSNGAAGAGWLMGPTGGYLLAFPIAAAVTGRLAGRVPLRWTVPTAMRLGAAILIGTAVIFAGGVAHLSLLTGDSNRAIELGVLPFITGDLLKVAATLLVALRYRPRTLGWL